MRNPDGSESFEKTQQRIFTEQHNQRMSMSFHQKLALMCKSFMRIGVGMLLIEIALAISRGWRP